MASSMLVVISVAVIGLSALAGALATWFVLRLLSRKRSGHQAEPAVHPMATEESAEPPLHLTSVRPTQDLPPQPQEPALILSVQHDEDGRLRVYVRGKPYGRLEEIADAQTGRDAVDATRAVLQFAERWITSAQRAPRQAVSKESPPTADKFLEDLEQHTDFVTSQASASTTAGRVLLAEQIDEFVQKRLGGMPELANLHVKLGSSATGALFIRVGSNTFDRVDAIPHAQVREIIQEAIRDWESE